MAITNSLIRFENGTLADAEEVLSNSSFILNNMIAFALDGATITNQNNLFTDLFTSDTAQTLTNFTYDAGNDWYETFDASAISTDYYMDIYTSTTTGISALAINNCVTQVLYSATGAYIYRMYCTVGTAEVQRAQVIKTLFYGTNGTDSKVQGITGLTNLKSSDARDVGKQAHYGYSNFSSTAASGDSEYQGTFVNTSTNTDCSTWSLVSATSQVWASTSAAWEMPNNTVLNNSGDETGTDMSADELNNPATCALDADLVSIGGGASAGWAIKTIILCVGDITWAELGTGSGTQSNIDFLTDHSIPLIEAATFTETDAIVVTGTKTLTSEDVSIIKTLTTVDSSNTLLVEFSANAGVNYQTVTDGVLATIAVPGTVGQLRFTITRTDNTTEDTIQGYGYYVG